jgi:hypothetical protein
MPYVSHGVGEEQRLVRQMSSFLFLRAMATYYDVIGPKRYEGCEEFNVEWGNGRGEVGKWAHRKHMAAVNSDCTPT